ncbi:hypothetical protein C4K39_5905 [Pseudomonas sessilinigenes]|nr:hypothetical protein C4K39_5905 [Pseudomonas sessilinigenes]
MRSISCHEVSNPGQNRQLRTNLPQGTRAATALPFRDRQTTGFPLANWLRCF